MSLTMPKSAAEKAWEKQLANHQSGGDRAPQPPPRPGDWICSECWPKVNNFATKVVCYRCGAPKPPPGTKAPEAPVGIKIGVRGDSFLQTRHDTAKLKKYRNFKHEMARDAYETFGNCTVDYEINPGQNLLEVIRAIADGPTFDVLTVGIGIQDLVDPADYSKIAPLYPSWLNESLQTLAAAIMSKATQSLVWVGGPADFWWRPKQWDSYMEVARNTLREAGIQVVPRETVNWVMSQMKLSKDGACISNEDEAKDVFSKTWVMCIHAAAGDQMWGRLPDAQPVSIGIGQVPVAATAASANDDLDELDPSILEFLQSQGGQADPVTAPQAGRTGNQVVADGFTELAGGRARSRSPPNQPKPFNPFSAYGYKPAY